MGKALVQDGLVAQASVFTQATQATQLTQATQKGPIP
jgi:hypothetical protein